MNTYINYNIICIRSNVLFEFFLSKGVSQTEYLGYLALFALPLCLIEAAIDNEYSDIPRIFTTTGCKLFIL